VSALVLASAARALASRSNELEKRSPHVVRPHLAHAARPWPAHGRRLPALDPLRSPTTDCSRAANSSREAQKKNPAHGRVSQFKQSSD
jgi:hypothetical protein